MIDKKMLTVMGVIYVILYVLIISLLVMFCWNYSIADLINSVNPINYKQSMLLVITIKLLSNKFNLKIKYNDNIKEI